MKDADIWQGNQAGFKEFFCLRVNRPLCKSWLLLEWGMIPQQFQVNIFTNVSQNPNLAKCWKVQSQLNLLD
jgi:hypothetical protein